MPTIHFSNSHFSTGNFNNDIDMEFEKICNSHPGCVDCPLKTEDKNYDGVILSCITGRNKR